MRWYDYQYYGLKPIHWLIVVAIIFGIFCVALAFKQGYELSNLKKEKEFYFEGDKEVTRIYYEGYITVKGSDGTFEIILEDYDKDNYYEKTE